ncbi:cytochrome P450 [uncultured Thermomonospora sp.]|uniref:cytochrome P450 n=1 Tax=uncultured Thermomonospora sp. TaxID=671175 RepID=UPI00259B8790|nr:cytochrome P450 [uncultured Thermomonospora sp.]
MDPQSRAAQPTPALRSLKSAPAEPLLTRDFDARPAAVYERLRSKYGPVAPVDLLGVPVWLVLGYAEVLEVLRNDHGLWSKRLEDWRDHREGRIPADWPLLPSYQGTYIAFQEGKAHTELREMWSKALRPFQDRTQPQALRLEKDVRQYADELISLMAEGGTSGWADLSAQYARPLMLMVCNRLIGFGTDEALMDIWRVVDAGPDAPEATLRLMAALAEVVALKRRRPGDDLPSHMLAARPDLTDEQLIGEIGLLLGLVGDIATSLICNTVVEVLTGDPGARASLAAGLVRETINRAAMIAPPSANLSFRFATADTVLGGAHIAAGDPVMPSVAAAHADPRFAAALDPSSVHSSRAHLAWGAGPHRCLGDELATTLVSIAVERLFEQMAALELALPADQLPWRSSPTIRGLRALPVRFRLGQAAERAPAPAGAASEEPATSEESTEPTASRSALSRLVRALLRQRS